MLETIMLVFAINDAPYDISNRIFSSVDECAEFVNTITGDNVVEQDGSFKFLSQDQIYFVGYCISPAEWEEIKL